MNAPTASSSSKRTFLRILLGASAIVVLTPLLAGLVNQQMLLADENDNGLSEVLTPAIPVDILGPPQISPADRPAGDWSLNANGNMEIRTYGSAGPVVVDRRVTVRHSRFAAIDQQSRELAMKLREAKARNDEDLSEALMNDLKAHLLEQFAARHETQAKQIQAAQDRIDALKQTHEKREQLKEEIVQRRINELIGEPDILRWDNQNNVSMPVVPSPPVAVFTPNNAPQKPSVNGFNSFGIIEQRNPQAASNFAPAGRALVPPSQPYQTRSTRIDVVNSPNADVFGIARRLLAAKIDLREAELRHEELSELAKKGAVPKSEVAKAAVNLQRKEAEIAFAEAELKAVKTQLDRESEFVQSQLKRAKGIVESARVRVSQGTSATDSVLKAESLLAESEKAKENVAALQQQLSQAQELIQQATDQEGAVKEEADNVQPDQIRVYGGIK